jgi:exodeoxyribonuclease-3
MKIATWNVNSIRTRLAQVIDWLGKNPVDVLCLQETKVVDPDFPRSPLEKLGYHLYISGQKSYNGVALISGKPMSDVSVGFAPVLGDEKVGEFDEQKRLITGIIDESRIISVYVPNGSTAFSDKYYYKLSWLKLLHEYLAHMLDKHEKVCIGGDFNIVPDSRDIHKKVLPSDEITGTTEPERQALQEIVELGLEDAFRKFTSEGGHYTWWDYRSRAFRWNRGWRIDHLYLSPALYQQATNCAIDIAPRKQPGPSDHAPVIVEF